MLSRIRRRVTYTNVAMTLAVVFAMTGGAYAAKHYVINSIKQIKPKVVKELKGARGERGAVGPAGPRGPQGEKGEKGEKGDKGDAGAQGQIGQTGPTGAVGATGAAGTTGPVGATGPEGVCSTAACTLPKNVMETGEWNILATGELVGTAVSFTIPLAKEIEQSHAHFIGEGEGEGEGKPAAAITAHECEGTYAEPKAASGHFCVFVKSIPEYETAFFPITGLRASGADTAGAQVEFFPVKQALLFFATGSWAVTG